MTPTEFLVLCEQVYGSQGETGRTIYGLGLVAAVAEDVGVKRRAVERWFTGDRKVPGWAIKSVEKTRTLRARG